MLFCAGLSDTGPVKPVNQDAYLLKRAQTAAGDIALLVVADGMSGLQQGEVAAGAIVHAFDAWFQRDLPLAGESLGFAGQAFSATVQVQWSNLLQEVNLSLLKSSARQGVSCGAACTIFMAAAGFYYAMQVGDTRLYCVRGNCVRGPKLVQLTHDQTFAARELEQGRMTRREAQEHPLRNALLQCVGASRNLSPVFLSGALENDATYVVCSDGFYKSLANAELVAALNAPELRAYAAGAGENAAGEAEGEAEGEAADPRGSGKVETSVEAGAGSVSVCGGSDFTGVNAAAGDAKPNARAHMQAQTHAPNTYTDVYEGEMNTYSSTGFARENGAAGVVDPSDRAHIAAAGDAKPNARAHMQAPPPNNSTNSGDPICAAQMSYIPEERAAAHLKAYLQKILNVVYARGQRDNATVAVVFPVAPNANAAAAATTCTASPSLEKGGSNA